MMNQEERKAKLQNYLNILCKRLDAATDAAIAVDFNKRTKAYEEWYIANTELNHSIYALNYCCDWAIELVEEEINGRTRFHYIVK